jgi:hypothetical protein
LSNELLQKLLGKDGIFDYTPGMNARFHRIPNTIFMGAVLAMTLS